MSAVLVPAALVIFTAYLLDLTGVGISPAVMAIVFLVAAACVLAADDRPRSRGTRASGPDAMWCSLVVAAAFAYFLWLASPSLLPITIAPDVVHHLTLIHLIQRTHHLGHDPALGPYLVEMAGYTPGSHILAALAGAWLRVDALRTVHAVAALFAALGSGVAYLIALRMLGSHPRAAMYALAAPIAAFVPAVYTLGAFLHFFFLAQIVSQTFALAMLLAVIDWVRGRRYALAVFVACGVAVFLTWPVWLGPPIAAVLAAAAWLRPTRDALRLAVLAVAPIVLVAAIHAAAHPGAGGVLASPGAVTEPSVGAFGIPLLVCAAAGLTLTLRRTVAVLLPVFLAAIAAEAFGLALLARVQGSRSLYLPFKMVYLAVPVLAVLASIAIAWASSWIGARVPRLRPATIILPVLVASLMLRGRVPAKRQHGSITESALHAGEWARDRLPTACVDYFSGYWLTGYWLHLDVLGNPRFSDRMRSETFEFRDVTGKWIEGRGLPYAFVEDFDAVPRDARVEMTILERFGRAAIVLNRRPAPCTDTSPPIWQVR